MKDFISKAISTFVTDPVWMFLLGLSAVLAFIGPFGTFEALSLPLRFLYWAPIVTGANLFVRLSHRIVNHSFADVSPLRWQLLTICVFSLAFSPAVWSYSGLFSAEFHTLGSLGFIFTNVFGVTLIVGMLVYYITLQPSAQQTSKRARIYDRLPEGTNASVVRLTVNDHYVEVYLDDGSSHRVLMRFADAVGEMDETPGFCAHRSHWVAADYVLNATREKNREFLMMQTGAKVPISKTYRENVETAGFL